MTFICAQTFNCSIDGAGNNNGIGLLVDIDNDARRNGTPDFVTDIGADEFDGTGSGLGVWRGVNSGGMMYKLVRLCAHCKLQTYPYRAEGLSIH